MRPEPPTDRLHALDAVRAGALLLGVLFHAAMAYLPGPQAWVVMDVERGVGAGIAFFTLHMFRMTTFFLIAGFFAHMLFHRRGVKGFLADRSKRIVIPLLVGWPILFAAIVAATIWAAAVMNGGVLPKEPPPMPPPPPFAFPLTHLWFLYVLLIFYAGALLLRSPVALVDRGGALRRGVDTVVRLVFATPLAPVFCALPMFGALAMTPNWMFWVGVPTPDNSLLPNTTSLIAYGFAFGLGWLLHRQATLITAFKRGWIGHLGLAIALTAWLLAQSNFLPHFQPTAAGPMKIALAGAYALAAWCWLFAFTGAALTFCAGHSTARRYIADASYWIYLVHLPIVMVGQVALSQLPWPWALKYLLVLVFAFPLMLGTYELFVRHSFIGGVLNGRKIPRAPKPGAQPKTGIMAKGSSQ
jgi:peptidoglycan/LPS O-acetylase OafA/YrhL